MERTPEPELMNEVEQAKAYSEANFEEPHNFFVELYKERFAQGPSGLVLDLGCGPADVTARFASAWPGARVHGVDGAPSMIELGRARLEAEGLADRVELHEGYLPGAELEAGPFQTIISNSLLHHLADPLVIWREAKAKAAPGAELFVMDLMRPATDAKCNELVEEHAKDEPEVLRRDFYHSLHAAYRPDEIEKQLTEVGLGQLSVEAVTDRHLVVWGRLS